MSSPAIIHILATDTGLQAHAVRAVAEHFGAQVTMTWAGNSAQIVEYLSACPAVDIIVLSTHGDDHGMLLPPLAEECRGLFPYFDVIDPAGFKEFLSLTGSIVLNHACMGGTTEMAEAFLSGGASAYIGAQGYPDTAASTKYVIDFLYAYIIQGQGDVEKAHKAAWSDGDDRRQFKLYRGQDQLI